MLARNRGEAPIQLFCGLWLSYLIMPPCDLCASLFLQEKYDKSSEFSIYPKLLMTTTAHPLRGAEKKRGDGKKRRERQEKRALCGGRNIKYGWILRGSGTTRYDLSFLCAQDERFLCQLTT